MSFPTMHDEFELIRQITERFATPDGVTLGIGDDSAVLDPGRFDLVTTDTMVEGVHFDLGWSSPRDIGWRALAVNLSDIAAMGGAPGVCFLNLSIPRDADASLVDGFLDGLAQAADDLIPPSFHVSLGGGDTTAIDGPMVVTLTLLGESAPAGPITRAGAVPGDRIVVLGALGMAAAAVEMLSGALEVDPEAYPELLTAHRRPTPRVHEGALLGMYSVPSALIDVSDGLLQDLGHIMARSAVGATIESHHLPRHPELEQLAVQTGAALEPWILTGGDDYELLITVPPARMPKLWELARTYEWSVYDIGEVRSADEGLRVLDARGELMEFAVYGYRHFRGAS
ncbi:MAG: thiamine-phosphate kinase [Myxococcota bacterium]